MRCVWQVKKNIWRWLNNNKKKEEKTWSDFHFLLIFHKFFFLISLDWFICFRIRGDAYQLKPINLTILFMILLTKYINQTILYPHQVHVQCYNSNLMHTLTQQHFTKLQKALIVAQVPSSLENLSRSWICCFTCRLSYEL